MRDLSRSTFTWLALLVMMFVLAAAAPLAAAAGSQLRGASLSAEFLPYQADFKLRHTLAQLDGALPEGETVWTARLLAKALGDVSEDHVWRVFRRHGIHLQRRCSWCVSTDSEFALKTADIVGLYLVPPDNALVICVDEKPSIQALERAEGYLHFSDGQTFRGFRDRYKRHGTTTAFGALEVATAFVTTGHYKRRRRIEFLDFMNKLIRQHPADQEIHVILDNLSTHAKKGGT